MKFPHKLEPNSGVITPIPNWAWAEENSKADFWCKECLVSHDRFHLYPYQREGVTAAESHRLRFGLGDEMGLGKTAQAIVAIRKNKIVTYPCLFVTKSALIFQVAHEIKIWATNGHASVYPIVNKKYMLPGFDFYVISMDLFARAGTIDELKKLGIKSIILDECHSYKDLSAKRTAGVRKFCRENNIEFRIPASGTPIKNRPAEFFFTHNIIDPISYPSEEMWKNQWLQKNEKNIYTKVKPWLLDAFMANLNSIMIRRTKAEVLPDLPALHWDYQLIEIEDQSLKDSYNSQVTLLRNFVENKADIDSNQLLGWLAKLRHITGQAKAIPAVEFAKDFLESSTDSICVGIHHTGVRDTIKFLLESAGIVPLTLSGEDSPQRKDYVARRFNDGQNERVLIANMQAGGIGLNLQNCANAVCIERPWSRSDEEQFAARFHRNGQKQAVVITVLIARNTIDEFFHNLVIEKSHMTAQVGIGEAMEETTSLSFLKELTEMVIGSTL